MGFKKASTIKVPDILFRTMKTGSPELDKTFSDTGGVVPSQVIFITGKPGAGKTTLAILGAVKLSMNVKRPGAFVSLEMSDFQLKHSAKKIPGFEHMMVETEFSLTNIFKNISALKPCVVVVDSIQKAAIMLVKQKEAVNFNQAQQLIVNEIYAFAKKTFIPFFLIGHMTKSGSYLGPAGLEHEVDSHMHVEYDQELDLRTFYYGKNRFGGSIDPQIFGISSEGVWIGSPYLTDREVTPGAKVIDVALDLGQASSRMRAVIDQFTERNLGKRAIGMAEIQICSKEMIEYLKVLDRNRIITDTHIKDPNRVRLSFKHKGVAHCVSKTGEIQIGDVMGLNRFNIGGIGYRKEQPFILRNCKTREDLFQWVIIHEWVHLYNGQQNHYVTFFQEVEKLYKKYKASLNPVQFEKVEVAQAAETTIQTEKA